MRQPYFNIFLDVVSESSALEICSDVMNHKPPFKWEITPFNANNVLPLRTEGISIDNEIPQSIFFVNAHCFNTAQIDTEYRNVLNSSDYIFNDGIGIKLGSYLAGMKIEDNLNGTDLIPQIIQKGVMNNKNIYLIGSYNGVAERAKYNLEKQYKDIHIVGTSSGFFSTKEEEGIISDINNLETDILIVGMGVPKQEIWINKIKNKLKTVKICIAGGAILDFMSGNINRAPIWMRKLNIEWIYRLYSEPKRMWKRYLVGNLQFFINIGRQLMNKYKSTKTV